MQVAIVPGPTIRVVPVPALHAGVSAHTVHYARAVLALALNLSCRAVFLSAVFHAAHLT